MILEDQRTGIISIIFLIIEMIGIMLFDNFSFIFLIGIFGLLLSIFIKILFPISEDFE